MKMSAIKRIKNFAKNNRYLSPVYGQLKERKRNRLLNKRLNGEYTFEERSRGTQNLCIVLAGYKEYLYSSVFGRLKSFAPEDMDVCILTSGKYSREISDICAENQWSYLSTEKNQVSLIQNIAIARHPNAEYIYKLDEDIFITENYFENMMRAYNHACEGDYQPGMIAPLIPVNGYGHVRILRKLNMMEEYERRFERAKHSIGVNWQLETSLEAARFFWGEDGIVPSIDEMNAHFSREKLEERPCPMRFSIGAVLFARELWQQMEYFPVCRGSSGIGADETYICQYCFSHARPIMVSENVVVGHLAFMRQNAGMKEYYLSHPEVFKLP